MRKEVICTLSLCENNDTNDATSSSSNVKLFLWKETYSNFSYELYKANPSLNKKDANHEGTKSYSTKEGHEWSRRGCPSSNYCQGPLRRSTFSKKKESRTKSRAKVCRYEMGACPNVFRGVRGYARECSEVERPSTGGALQRVQFSMSTKRFFVCTIIWSGGFVDCASSARKSQTTARLTNYNSPLSHGRMDYRARHCVFLLTRDVGFVGDDGRSLLGCASRVKSF